MPPAGVWHPNHSSIVAERDPYAPARALSLRHDIYPYEEPWPVGDWPELRRIAGGYLFEVAQRFGLPNAVNLIDPADGLFVNRPGRLQLTWLPVSPSTDPRVLGLRHPRWSFWARRYRPNGAGDPIEQQVILLAVPATIRNQENTETGSRLGIRIVARATAGAAAGDPWNVAITGSACSLGFAEALGPSGIRFFKALGGFFMNAAGVKNTFIPLIRSELRLDPAAPLRFEGFRILETGAASASTEVYFNLPRPDDGDEPLGIAYAIRARAEVESNAVITVRIRSIERMPLVANSLFREDAHPEPLLRQPRDPASQPGLQNVAAARANRAPLLLRNDYCDPAPANVPGLAPGPDLIDDQQPPQVMVMQSRLVNPNGIPPANRDPAQPERANLALPHPRADRFAAVAGFRHARGLFDRMRLYGLPPELHFTFAAMPLRIRYRETIHPGPGKDGKTMNAAVDYDPPNDAFAGGWNGNPADLRPLQIRFALADVKRSLSRRQPMGIAADPRWAWHEYGHVLLAAATGGLELPFAHSPGDALAAIASDPQSRLSTMFGGRLRGATFPWAHVGRHHDRQARLGWSWAGTFHRSVRLPAYTSNALRKGYHSEQILSSSLFRLHRSLGGDTFRVPAIRTASADYALYLIIRAIQLLPPATAGSAQTPEQFVNALIDADNGTVMVNNGPIARRAGGWARKVIRWAFEAQGLYANVGPDVVHNAPGLPPNVDVFIDDLRPDSDSIQPRGGYMPVQLDWAHPPGEPSWLADPAALQIVGSNITVEVRNRGAGVANGVTVRVWYARAPNLNNVPRWTMPQWNEILGGINAGPQNIGAAGGWFGPWTLPNNLPHGQYLVLASASCVDDPSNIETALPVATSRTPIVDLVAGDNNIGLRVINV
jgi:hypothetical protein